VQEYFGGLPRVKSKGNRWIQNYGGQPHQEISVHNNYLRLFRSDFVFRVLITPFLFYSI
jgi:hypothetical protein